MNDFSSGLNESKRPEDQKPAQQKRSAGLLLSGVLVAISLIAFVLPLAAYHVAQVASVLRVRSGLFLLAAVATLLYVLGFMTRLPVFVMAGTVGLCATPFLAAAFMLRVKKVELACPWRACATHSCCLLLSSVCPTKFGS